MEHEPEIHISLELETPVILDPRTYVWVVRLFHSPGTLQCLAQFTGLQAEQRARAYAEWLEGEKHKARRPEPYEVTT